MMKTDKYNNPILTTEEGKQALLYGNSIENVLFDDELEVEKFQKNVLKVLGHKAYIANGADEDFGVSVDEYHAGRTAQWDIPFEYTQIDVKQYLLDRCLTDEEQERVLLEYAMFEERELMPLLQFLIFIVDHMRKKKIVWGVGRGSSVASYSLYLMGVHKVNSLKYNLPIEEFLK